MTRHAGEDFVQFLDEAVVRRHRQQIHLILDKLSVHKTIAMREWLELHPHVRLHFTLTYSSRLTQVESWLGIVAGIASA